MKTKGAAQHGGKANGSGFSGIAMEQQREQERLSARPHGGSIGAAMNQGGQRMHANDHTIPQLMNQGPSDKRGNETHVPTRKLMNQ